MTTQQRLDQIWEEAQQALGALNFDGFLQKVSLWFQVLGANVMSLIDMNAAISFITNLFPKKPEISWLTQGEAPKAAEVQALCSQGVVTIRSAGVLAATTSVPNSSADGNGNGNDDEGISFAG
jgi:hypothetical protein